MAPQAVSETAEIDGLGNRTEWAFDDRGNRILERDALGHETRWSYNEVNVEVERIDAAGGVWKRDHDGRGKLVRAVNPLGEVTRFKHDRRGNPSAWRIPRGASSPCATRDAGELAEVIDRRDMRRGSSWTSADCRSARSTRSAVRNAHHARRLRATR